MKKPKPKEKKMAKITITNVEEVTPELAEKEIWGKNKKGGKPK